MIAVDANVLLRLIVQDDTRQLAIAKVLVTKEDILVPLTVTLECEWVLRSYYRFPPAHVAAGIDALTDLERLRFEHVDGVRWALGRMVAGADFADMIHLVQAHHAHAARFATFDAGVAPEAGIDAPVPVSTLA